MSKPTKEEILAKQKEIDMKQLENVNGGSSCQYRNYEVAEGKGSCSSNFYNEKCGATVEVDSDCGCSNDYCRLLWNNYTYRP